MIEKNYVITVLNREIKELETAQSVDVDTFDRLTKAINTRAIRLAGLKKTVMDLEE